jgi:hypothetical protein
MHIAYAPTRLAESPVAAENSCERKTGVVRHQTARNCHNGSGGDKCWHDAVQAWLVLIVIGGK